MDILIQLAPLILVAAAGLAIFEWMDQHGKPKRRAPTRRRASARRGRR